jgi:hypothetical protein
VGVARYAKKNQIPPLIYPYHQLALLNEFPQGIEDNLKGIYRLCLNNSFTYIKVV